MTFNAIDILYTAGPTDDEQAYVAWLMQLFSSARNGRVNYEVQWEEAAALCWPEYRQSFAFGHVRAPGIKYTEFQVDSAGSIASHRFMAIADALITPHTMLWSVFKAADKSLMRAQRVKDYYRDVTEEIWTSRYRWDANFLSQNQTNWQALAVFGNHGMWIDELEQMPGENEPGVRYSSTAPGEIYKLKNHQGRTTGVIRHFRWTAREAFTKWKERTPRVVLTALQKNDVYTRWDFLQFVLPNTEYDPLQIFNYKGKRWVSVTVCIAGQCIVEKNGYRKFPWAGGGYMSAPEEDYDRGPAQMVLPSLKTLNSEAAMILKADHKAVEPAYLIAQEGINNLLTAPNSRNYGGMNSDGRPLAAPLTGGNIQVTPEMIARQQKFVDDAFLTSLFPLLMDNKNGQKSAREVVEEAAHRGIFLGPTLGRQFGEYLGMMVERELDIAAWQGRLPPLPPELKEAKGQYTTVWCSPLARAFEEQGIAGYMQTHEMANQISQATGDVSVLDVFDDDVAIPEIADIRMVPSRWMADDKKIAAKRKTREDAAERDRQVKELPGKAAMAKAQAIVAKAQTGGNIGGTLSGVPQGQMPIMPGQQQNGGSAFGQPGLQGG